MTVPKPGQRIYAKALNDGSQQQSNTSNPLPSYIYPDRESQSLYTAPSEIKYLNSALQEHVNVWGKTTATVKSLRQKQEKEGLVWTVAIRDPGGDADDIAATAKAELLRMQGAMHIPLRVSTAFPAKERAKIDLLVKEDQHGTNPDTIIAYGADEIHVNDDGSYFSPTEIPPYELEHTLEGTIRDDDEGIVSMDTALDAVFAKAENAGATVRFECTGGLEAAMDYFATRDDLLVPNRIKEFIFQGGFDDSDEGFVAADVTAANNKFHLPKAKELIRRIAERNIPMSCVTRDSALPTAPDFSLSFYKDVLAATGNPIGSHLLHSAETVARKKWRDTYNPKLVEKYKTDQKGYVEKLTNLRKGDPLYDEIMQMTEFPEDGCEELFARFSGAATQPQYDGQATTLSAGPELLKAWGVIDWEGVDTFEGRTTKSVKHTRYGRPGGKRRDGTMQSGKSGFNRKAFEDEHKSALIGSLLTGNAIKRLKSLPKDLFESGMHFDKESGMTLSLVRDENDTLRSAYIDHCGHRLRLQERSASDDFGGWKFETTLLNGSDH